MDKRKLNNETGITIIALSITIIVMLILAGISIATVSPMIKNSEEAKQEQDIETEKSIVSRATLAAEKVGVKGEITQANLQKMMKNELPSGNFTVTENGDSFTITFTDSNRSYDVDAVANASDYNPASEGVPIPDGFYYVGGTKDSGLVISDNSADERLDAGKKNVRRELAGNQFVWIPVDNSIDYKRVAYSTNFSTGTTDTTTNSEKINYSSSDSNYFTEALPVDEESSVKKNKGYYIGRYESGDQESTNSKTLRASGASTSNAITVKAGQAPYNYIKYTDAKSLAEGFSEKQGYTSVKSKLVSGYAWDTAIAFIQKKNSDYGNSSKEGNYFNTTFSYTGIGDTEVNKRNKADRERILIPTGQTTAVNNIYDMGGNVDEWSTEFCYDEWEKTTWYTWRGGDYSDYYTSKIYVTYPAGIRGCASDKAFKGVGFRITLFL